MSTEIALSTEPPSRAAQAVARKLLASEIQISVLTLEWNLRRKSGIFAGRYLLLAAHPLSAALCGSGLVYACVY